MDHTPPEPLRASDAERDRTAARLRDAVGEGRLGLAEADDRITAAYAAVHRHDLDVLTADLPAPTPPPAPPPGPPAAPTRRRPPLPVLALLLLAAVAWIASPLPFPWPLLLLAFLITRAARRRRDTITRPHPPLP